MRRSLCLTPGKAAIADVTEFFGIAAAQDIKCVAFMGAGSAHKPGEPLRPVVAFLRGDHQVNETKLNAIAGTGDLRPMMPEELALHIGGPAGYLGPVGIAQIMTEGSLNGLKSGKALDKLKGVLRDNPSEGLRTIVVVDLACRAARTSSPARTSSTITTRTSRRAATSPGPSLADIRNVNEGELDPIGGQPLRIGKAVEVGHIFKLGYKYSESMGARVLDAQRQRGHADHGLLRHRHRAHPDRGDRELGCGVQRKRFPDAEPSADFGRPVRACRRRLHRLRLSSRSPTCARRSCRPPVSESPPT